MADVRLTPLSRKPGFSKSRLRDRLEVGGIDCRHLRVRLPNTSSVQVKPHVQAW